MDKDELQKHLEEEIREFISSIAEQIEEIMYKEAEKQLEEDIEEEKFSRRMPVIRSQIEVPEEMRELKELKENLQNADKIIHDNPRVMGDQHDFVDNPYREEPRKEVLEQFSEGLKEIDREKVLSADLEEIQKAREAVNSFREKRKEK